MAVSVEVHVTGVAHGMRGEIAAIVEHVLSDRPGEWRVSISGSQESDSWALKIAGPNAFERSYALGGSAGEHDPQVVARIVARMVTTHVS